MGTMARLKQDAGRISARDILKSERGHWVVCRGMFGKKRKKQKPTVSLILTKANAPGPVGRLDP